MATREVLDLVNEDGNKFYPKTHSKAVFTDEGNTINDALGGKVDKVEGKQLSTEDFTTLLKEKLENLNENSSGTGEGGKTEMIVMKAYLFDMSGTYTQTQIESVFNVTLDELMSGIKEGKAIVITSSSDANGNYNIVFGATYTVDTSTKKMTFLSMLWWQYSQWVTLNMTYNSSSDNYTVALTKTVM